MISSVSSGFLVIADAINRAAGCTAPGDVILLEQQEWSVAFANYCPVEATPDIYSAINNASALTGSSSSRRAMVARLDLDHPAWSNIFSAPRAIPGHHGRQGREYEPVALQLFVLWLAPGYPGMGLSVATLAYGDRVGRR